MSLYVLDTDILSLYQLGHPVVVDRVAAHSAEDLAVTIITVDEQLSAWYTLRRRAKGNEQLARVYARFAENVRFVSQLNVLPFSLQAIERYEALLRSKLHVKANDLRIAAITLEANAVIVTRNKRDFERVSGLVIEDWSLERLS